MLDLVPAIICSLALSVSAFAQGAPNPLNRAEILGRLALGQHPSVIARLAKTRGTNFSPDASFLAFVARAGGNGILYERIFSSSQTASASSVGADSDPSFAQLATCAELLHSAETERAEPPVAPQSTKILAALGLCSQPCVRHKTTVLRLTVPTSRAVPRQ